MPVAKLELTSRKTLAPIAGAPQYERLDGVLHYAVDPAKNPLIIDLDKAQRAADGLVHYQGDFCLLQPVDPAGGSRRLLFDVANRGRKLAVNMFDRCAYNASPLPLGEGQGEGPIDPGDGFLFRHGWTIAWAGWQWDVVRSPQLMGQDAPQALGEDGQPVRGQAICQFQPVNRDADRLLADRIHHPYPAADIDDPTAELAVREWPDGPRTVIPRERWRFAQDNGGQPVSDDRRVWLEGGFEPGCVYEVIYQTRVCPVVGAGLLAVRDTVSFLRSDRPDNPCNGRLDRAHAFGMSQSGRFLRHFLNLGLNLDEEGRQIFDGMQIHVAGARRGEFNNRYAQPSSSGIRSFGHLPPFQDHQVFARQQSLGGMPRVVATNSSAEYWRGDASLQHITSNVGQAPSPAPKDIEPPPDVRLYHLSGSQHVPGRLPSGFTGPDGSRSGNPSNPVDYSPLLRAALENLDRWVSEGVEPPGSRHPTLAAGTAVPAREALTAVQRVVARGETPGAAGGTPALPDYSRLPAMVRLDLGPDTGRGIARYPAKTGAAYRTYVPAVDENGNELGGVRLPDLTVPLGTYTGWNPRDPNTGGAGQIISMKGSVFPFSPAAIQARYKDKADYLEQVRGAAERLVAEQLLLQEDVETVLALSSERWDAYAGQP